MFKSKHKANFVILSYFEQFDVEKSRNLYVFCKIDA